MANTTGATAVAERPTDALWLAALPAPRIARTQDRLPVRAAHPAELAEGALSGLPGAITDMAVARDGRFLVAAHYGEDAVSFIDLETLALRTTVTDLAEPYAVAAAERVYVSSAAIADDSLVAVEPVTGVALGAREISGSARGLAVSPAGDLAYVARNSDASADIAVIDVESGKLVAIPVLSAATVDTVRINADGSRAFAAITTATGAALAVVDTRARRTVAIIDLPGSVGDIAVHPDGRRVVATGWDAELGGTVTIVDAANGRVVESIAMGGLPTQVVLTSTRAFVATGDEIAVLALGTSEIVGRIAVGRPVSCLAISRDETRLYVADFDGGLLARSIDPAEKRLRAAS